MGGLRHRAGRVAGVTKAVLAAVLLGGTLTAGLSLALETQATAFSATPSWFNTDGTPASSLTCGNWYFATMSSQTGGGSAAIGLTGGGGGGGGSSTSGLSQQRELRRLEVPGARCPVPSLFRQVRASPPSSDAVVVVAARTAAVPPPREAAGTGYSSGGTGGEQGTAITNQSGGGAGGGSTAVCVYGNDIVSLCDAAGRWRWRWRWRCRWLHRERWQWWQRQCRCQYWRRLEFRAEHGSSWWRGQRTGIRRRRRRRGQSHAGCRWRRRWWSRSHERYTPARRRRPDGTGAANSTGGLGGAEMGSGSGPKGTAGIRPELFGHRRDRSDADQWHRRRQGGGGGGGGYYGGGSGASNDCTLCPALGAGGGGAGSSWVSTSALTTFTNGSNPSFTAGSAFDATTCGQHETQGSSGGTNGAGGIGAHNTSAAEPSPGVSPDVLETSA